jgi:hypothetical protein
MFVGYGNFYQSKTYPSVVAYDADIIPDALFYWIRAMAFTSKLHRYWGSFRTLFSPLSRKQVPSQAMSRFVDLKVSNLEKRVNLLNEELERYQILEMFALLPSKGDAFSALPHGDESSVDEVFVD